jgi:hypothetical protein
MCVKILSLINFKYCITNLINPKYLFTNVYRCFIVVGGVTPATSMCIWWFTPRANRTEVILYIYIYIYIYNQTEDVLKTTEWLVMYRGHPTKTRSCNIKGRPRGRNRPRLPRETASGGVVTVETAGAQPPAATTAPLRVLD